ncbi:hypothetical protein MKK55_11420 [Methylobacterium sp. J-059]|nr:hypothetical protein [Methylobacterium sp. J-059]MCJ2039545.1 hypothetical protein [Methylobacterium sp. J-059]
MAGFVALIHWFGTAFGEQFGTGFGTGAIFSAVILGTWMWLNAKGHFDHL